MPGLNRQDLRPRGAALSQAIFARLADDEESAAVALFMQLLKNSPALRTWLWAEFARSTETRERTARHLDQGTKGATGGSLLDTLTGERDALERERARLKSRWPARAKGAYGGLSERRIEALIRRYQAGNLHLGAFLLMHAWRRHQNNGNGLSPRLLRASYAYLQEATSRPALLRELPKAEAFFAERTPLRKTDYGYGHWWKFCLLLYLLNHPKPDYRTSELRRHLSGLRLQVDPKDIRSFCKRYGIARDIRGGRPRKRS